MRLALVASHVLVAVLAVLLTSLYWIAAQPPEPAPERAKKEAARVEGAAGPTHVAPSGLAIPVAGIRPEDLSDTFSDARAGGARVHDAIDIMAPAGTPVVAAAPGMVEKLFFSEGGGGITAYVRSEDGKWIYYYAHLQDYAPGLAEGRRLARGDPIGRVGSTGNASPDGPHLHFAVHRMAPGESWHQGRAVNPYPLLAGQASSR